MNFSDRMLVIKGSWRIKCWQDQNKHRGGKEMEAVVIPAYEPDEKLKMITEKLRDKGYIVIIVDDGSGDAYHSLFEELSEECIVLKHEKNRGKGAAIKTALEYIAKELWDCDFIGTMDADGQHTPEDMEHVLAEARKFPNALTLGVREIGQDMPLRSRIGNGMTRTVFKTLYGQKISDTQTGLRAFPVSMIPWMRGIDGDGYEYEMKVLIEAARDKIPFHEVPIQTIYHDRGNSCSHFHVFRDSFRIWRELLGFACSSLSSFAVDYSLFCLLTAFVFKEDGGFFAANIFARMFSAVYNYEMNCRFVFRVRENGRSFAGYAALAAVVLMCNSLVLAALAAAGIQVYVAKIMTECVMFFFSWAAQKHMIFRKRGTGYEMGV